MGERLVDVVERRQAWDVDDVVVHLPAFRPPRHVVVQDVEEGVPAGEPRRTKLHPGTGTELGPDEAVAELVEGQAVIEVEERPLHRERHPDSVAQESNRCSDEVRVS